MNDLSTPLPQPPRNGIFAVARSNLARLVPYAVYTVLMTGAAAVCWGRVRPSWLIIAASTYVALVIIQLFLNFFADSGPIIDAPSGRHDWIQALRTMPIALLWAAPVPILGACLISGDGTFAGVCLVVVGPAAARLIYNKTFKQEAEHREIDSVDRARSFSP